MIKRAMLNWNSEAVFLHFLLRSFPSLPHYTYSLPVTTITININTWNFFFWKHLWNYISIIICDNYLKCIRWLNIQRIKVIIRTCRWEFHGQELHLLLQRLDVVDDLIKHTGFTSNFVASRNNVSKTFHLLAYLFSPCLSKTIR